MNLKQVLDEIRELVSKEHPLEIFAGTDCLLNKLDKEKLRYEGNSAARHLEMRCLSSTYRALKLFVSDLKEWNLSRRTEGNSLEVCKNSSFTFLRNLIQVLEEDLKYVNKLKVQDASKKLPGFWQRMADSLKETVQ